MNIFQDTFSTGQVVDATGVSNATLQSWLKRNVIIGHKDRGEIEIKGGGSPGRHRRFSFYSVMQIAVAKALIDSGLTDLKAAFQAAAHFAHAGVDRLPAIPFNTGSTLLCASDDKTTIVRWIPGSDPLANIITALGHPLGFVLVEINPVFDRVVATLGHHPEQVLESVYRGSNK